MVYDGLVADSSVYKHKSDMYEKFSQAEDTLKKIVTFLIPKIKDKAVLDFGCGTGKFILDLAPIAKTYVATDINETQLEIAKKKSLHLENVEILKTEKDTLPFKDQSFDVIFSTWVIGSIQDLELRARILKEFKRVLRPGGFVYLVENDVGGEYKDMTGGEKANERTAAKLLWLKDRGPRKISFPANEKTSKN